MVAIAAGVRRAGEEDRVLRVPERVVEATGAGDEPQPVDCRSSRRDCDGVGISHLRFTQVQLICFCRGMLEPLRLAAAEAGLLAAPHGASL